MPFSTRNSYYLRISKNTVLPTYVYLDERHVNWMSDTVLQYVLSDLRPHILFKLKAEADIVLGGSSSKKPSVDTHRGDTYQFCYFIRKTEPHSVVVKSRNFLAAKPQPKRLASTVKPATSRSKKGKRKEKPQDTSPERPTRSKKRRTTTEAAIELDDEDDDDDDDDDVEMVDPQDVDDPRPRLPADDDASNQAVMDLEIEEEEEKPKPILSLKYQGFSIYGHCLCVVVEPWPVVRTMTGVAAALTKTVPRPSTSRPPQPTGQIIQQDPLFLPEEVEEEEDRNRANKSPPTSGQYVNKPYLDQVSGVIELSDDEDVGGMMEFSQVLRSIGDSRAGAINDDEDMDGSVLFGDADEYREL